MESTQIDSRTAEAIRQQFDVAPGGFTCILVGKDGGVKLRRISPYIFVHRIQRPASFLWERRCIPGVLSSITVPNQSVLVSFFLSPTNSQ